jgi:hypothetical protein
MTIQQLENDKTLSHTWNREVAKETISNESVHLMDAKPCDINCSKTITTKDINLFKQELISFSTESVRKEDVLTFQFQKFTFTKLILRLITDLSLEMESCHTLPYSTSVPSQTVSTLKNSNADALNEMESLSVSQQNDGLCHIKQQLTYLLRSLTRDGDMRHRKLFLQMEPPILSPELDELVVGLAALAKLCVTEIVVDSMKNLLAKHQDTNDLPAYIDPSYVYETIETINRQTT